MLATRKKYYLYLTFAMIFILACSTLTGPTPQPAATLNSLYTAAAETLIVMSTQQVVTQTASPTSTLSLGVASPTEFPTYTSVLPLQNITKCDAAAFVTDVTYPDGSVVGRGNAFTKTWRIKNVGTCTWTTSYDLVYVSGEKFGAGNSLSLPVNVGPGKTVDLSIQLTAPNQDGRFKGYWRLRNSSGTQFGFGALGNSHIYVDVNVSGYTVTGYDLASNFCEATWKNTNKHLSCPSNNGSNNGFVLSLDAPKMEDGNVRGVGLLTHPEMINNGIITGKYPNFKIQQGDHFKALIGCLNTANDCDLIFKLEYQIGNSLVKTLGQWHEIYEGKYYSIDMDLSSLSGQKIKLILTVLSNGSSHEDHALWVNPRITRQSSQPATATPSPSPSPTITDIATSTPTASETSTPTETPSETPTIEP